MRFRTVALALALTFGLSAIGEARQKPAITRVKARKTKARKNRKVKARKMKVVKRRVKR
jgi:hypothetical protein